MVGGVILQLRSEPAARLKQRAKELGVTPAAYIERLMAVELEVGKAARLMRWEEAVRPYREALSGLSEDELDKLVEEARRAPEKKRRKR